MNGINKQINYWKDSSKRDLDTALVLYKGKRYDACLFFCHLTLEKILKGLFVKFNNDSAPYIHDLAKLGNLAGLNLTDEQITNLRIISQFNIAGRYDNFKQEFYKQCTKAYAEKYLSITNHFYLWLKEKFQKK